MADSPLRKTILNEYHAAAGARLVDFAGWSMPVQYTGIIEEAKTVRAKAGLFDLGHMGRVLIRGADGEALLQRAQTNDVSKIKPGAIRYSMFLDEAGRTQDDILVYREPEGEGFYLVVNASNTARDLGILRDIAAGFGDAQVIDQTDELGMFAIQGPASEAIAVAVVQALGGDLDPAGLKYYHWARGTLGDGQVAMSRTGYTGEDGYEIYAPTEVTPVLWQAFLEAGRAHGIAPIGLAARDTLRLEAGMALYGHEIDESTDPLEAGLSFAVKFTHDFIGRTALEERQAAGGSGRQLCGLRCDSKRIPRQGYELYDGDEKVGVLCSGGASPTLGTNIATAYLPTALAEPGRALEFDVRGRREPAVVCALPFYKRPR